MSEHTHEFDCIVCGAHFDSQEELHRHDMQKHEPKNLAAPNAPAEPIGNEREIDDRDDPRSLS